MLIMFIHKYKLSNSTKEDGKCLLVLSSVKGKFLTSPSVGESATSYVANVGNNLMNPRIRILPLPSVSDLSWKLKKKTKTIVTM